MAKKKPNRIFRVGEKVCFFIFVKGVPDPVWHIGEIVEVLPVQKPGDEQLVSIVPYEIPDESPGEKRPQGDSESDAPLYFLVPRELVILGHLASQTPWTPKKLPAVTVDVRRICGAKHHEFQKVFSNVKLADHELSFPWHR